MREYRQKCKWLLLIFLISISFLATACRKKQEKRVEPPLRLLVSKVLQKDLPENLLFTGDLEGDQRVQVHALISDRIKALYVDIGDRVKKGQKLAVIEHTRLRQAEAQVRAQVAGARSQLAGAKVNLTVTKVANRSAKREYKRLHRLLKSGAVGSQTLDRAKTQVESSTARIDAAKAQIQALRAQIRALRAGFAQARTVRKNALIRAPISGIVARRSRQVGDMASPQIPLFTLVQMDLLKVNIKVTEKNLHRIKLGDRAIVKVLAHPTRKFVALVTKIAPTLDLETRTAPVEMTIPNLYQQVPLHSCRRSSDCKDEKYNACLALYCKRGSRCRKGTYCQEKHPLKPGMIAQVSLRIKIHKNALLIPLQALLNSSFGYEAALSQKDLSVLILDKNKKPMRQKIKIGLEVPGGMVQVLSGLHAGQDLVIAGHNLYKTGTKVRILRKKRASKI